MKLSRIVQAILIIILFATSVVMCNRQNPNGDGASSEYIPPNP